MIPKTIGALYVGNYPQHIAEIKLNHVLRQLNNKIIECKWDYNLNCWVFMRERTDKSFPNSYKTAQGNEFFKKFFKWQAFLAIISSVG